MKVLSNETLMPVGLVITIMAGAVAVGASFTQISANAEDNEDQDAKIAAQESSIREIDRDLTRSLILQENVNTVTARQAETQGTLTELLGKQDDRILRLEILIERLSVEGGTMDQ